jgi:diguanylate cyclase (GGDEF)-like protein
VTAVARTLYLARRKALEWWGLLAAIGFAGLLSLGVVTGGALWRGDLLLLSGLGIYAFTLARAITRDLLPAAGRPARGLAAGMRELELGLLLLVGVYLLVSATGGARSFLYPLVYALVSFLLVVNRRRWVAAAWVAAACGLELIMSRVSAPGSWMVAAYHITFILFFAAGNLLVLSSLARRMRGDHGRRLTAELARMKQEARDFRLIASQLPASSRAERSRAEEELRMAAGAVQGVHDQLFFTIDLLSSSLGLHTCALLWTKDEGSPSSSRATPTLEIKEMATLSEMVREMPEIESPGILAGALREQKSLRLKALNGKRLPPYYQGPENVTDLCVVPLKDGAALRGLLCADRTGNREFTDEEEEVLRKAGEHVQRIIEQERSFVAVEQSKYEQEQFYKASELLNQALTVEDVYDKSFTALGSIVSSELIALTSYDEGGGLHKVLAARVSSDEKAWKSLAEKLQGATFSDGPGLVSIAVKNRHHMPATGQLADPDTEIFGDMTLKRAKSLLVLPLQRGDQVQGTLVMASSRPNVFPARTRDMIRVIGNQIGVSLQNARMYESMELRATTDGLTGLTNHRAFQERFEQVHALAERAGQKCSVILTDIDHFKNVNDTYGHPVGDAVLKRVAAIFAGRARKVDIVARYGGEEFVIVLPDTDSEGAALFANRVREEVAAQSMTSENGSFQVTISMGVAEFPSDGKDRFELIERADQALYYCKEHGRNRVTRWADLD